VFVYFDYALTDFFRLLFLLRLRLPCPELVGWLLWDTFKMLELNC